MLDRPVIHGPGMRENLCFIEEDRTENCSLESVYRVGQGQDRRRNEKEREKERIPRNKTWLELKTKSLRSLSIFIKKACPWKATPNSLTHLRSLS